MKHAFLGFKKREFEKSKNGHFSKGEKKGVDGFGPKMTIFSTSLLKAKQGSKMSFMILWNEKNGFLGYKNKKFKQPKSCHFCKGVNKWFLDKNGHFCSFFFFWQNRPGKSLLQYSTTNKRLSWL